MDCHFLSKTILFRGTKTEEICPMLDCLGAEQKQYKRNETIFHSGDIVHSIGLVLSGRVQVENDDFWGNRSVLDSVGPGMIFAESYACVPGEPLMVNVIAAETADILFLNVGRLLKTCPSSCEHHNKLIQNLLTLSAQKNLNLSRRIFHTSPKSIRDRLLSYLSFQATQQGSYEFSIPFNRQQLADYLSVDRSALSNELSKMQKDGLLKVEKNHFVLKEGPVESAF